MVAESCPCPKTGRRGKGSSLGINNDVFKKMCRCIKITIPPKKHILAIFLSAAVVLKEEYESFFYKTEDNTRKSRIAGHHQSRPTSGLFCGCSTQGTPAGIRFTAFRKI